MRMSVPSLPGGERTLPAELRTAHVPRGEAYGWHRLHANLAPSTEGPHGVPFGMHGLGVDTSLIPVDPIPSHMPPVFLGPPVHAPTTTYSGGGMPTYIQSQIGSGAIVPQRPPNAPAGAQLQHWPWGYVWAHVIKTSQGPVVTWMSERPDTFLAHHSGMSGLGQGCYDTYGNPIVCADGSISQVPTETPYPVIFSDPTTGAPTSTAGMTPQQIAAMINASSNALTRTLAITQGGSISASGNIYGSPQTASIAAGFPQNQLAIGGAGVTGILSSPLLLMLLAGGLLLMMSGRK